MRAFLVGILTLACLTLMCNKREAASKAEVREAIETHLKQRGNMMMANMDLEVQEVKTSGDTADALVQFRSKQSPSAAVGVSYKLRRVDGRWKVESTSPSGGMGGNPHGGGGMPAPAPATGAEETPLQSSH